MVIVVPANQDAGKASEESKDDKTGESAETKDEKPESSSADDQNKTKEQKKEDKKPKLTTIRADIRVEKLAKDLTDPSKEKLMLSKKLLVLHFCACDSVTYSTYTCFIHFCYAQIWQLRFLIVC